MCPGRVQLSGFGSAAVVASSFGRSAATEVRQGGVVSHLNSRAYFADSCREGTYDHTRYLSMNLLGKTIRYTTHMAGAGCGCNAALYLVSMRQNSDPSKGKDYYCDANSVGGVNCAEIDIQEANMFAWRSTLHRSNDGGGKGSGYGGGLSARAWTSSQFSPGSWCIDTSKPFDVEVSFPVANGVLSGMAVRLSQAGRNCPLGFTVSGYSGMAELTQALAQGMTPVVSYWNSNNMLWLDGKGSDGKGPCAQDEPAKCGGSVAFYNFAVYDIGAAPAGLLQREPSTREYAAVQDEDVAKDSGFCCLWASSPSDACGSCGTPAPAGSWCAASTGQCANCAGTWCGGSVTPTAPPPTPTPAPTPMPTPMPTPTPPPVPTPTPAPVPGTAMCPGAVELSGFGPAAVVNSGFGRRAATEVRQGGVVVPHFNARAYFADACRDGTYDHNRYLAVKLLGKTIRYTTNMAGAGCGCNAAFYLVSMQQNSQPSKGRDYYCDASRIGGVACAEIDIQEANQFAWISTLHGSGDLGGKGSGYGGGRSARQWTSAEYSPGGRCIDTSRPFNVEVSFPVAHGVLSGMTVRLSQEGRNCPLGFTVSGYSRMAELTQALAQGMTPVVSYWGRSDITWLDGKGVDGKGPCAKEEPSKCGKTVAFYDFSIYDIGAAPTGSSFSLSAVNVSTLSS